MTEGQAAGMLPAMRFSRLIFPAIASALVFPLGAVTQINWDKAPERMEIGDQLYYFEDATKSLDIQKISAPDFQHKFKLSQSKTLNFGQTNYDYWLRMTFTRSDDVSVARVLEIDQSNIDVVELYTPAKSNVYSAQKTGMQTPFSTREIKNRNFVFTIDLAKGETKTYYMHARTCGGLIIPPILWAKDRFVEHNANVQHGIGIYYGIMLVMILYNLFIFFSVRDVSYFYYVCYIFGLLWLQLVLTGHGFEYLWSNSPWLQRNSYILSSGFMLAAVLMFAKRFLNTKILVPRIDKAIKVIIGLEIALFFSPVFLPPEITTKVSLALTIPPLILVFAAAVIAFVKKYRPARFFLLAFTVLQIAGIVVVLKFTNVLGSSILTDYGLYFGSALEVVLLSIALADRINIMKREKDEAQRKTLQMQKILTDSYARFVPHDFLANLGKESILDVKLGDQVQKNMAILFSDIRAFTTLSESMTPEQNFNFINSYLGRMSPIVQRHSGFIDKFIGDAIMALFERSVADGVAAGVEMQLYLKDYNLYRKNKGFEAIQIGIGIHTGSLMLGTIGAENRLEGTVISDTVNLASRIENLTKVYGARIAVSETTVTEIRGTGKFNYRFLDRVRVKGKTQPVAIYEVFDGDDAEIRELKQQTLEDYSSGVKAFIAGDMQAAQEYITKVLNINTGDRAARLYEQRIAVGTAATV